MTTRRTNDQFQVLSGRLGASDGEEPAEAEEFRFPAAREFAGPQKGANVARRKSVLGRGLSALLSSSAVPVDISEIPLAGVGGSVLAENQRAAAEAGAPASLETTAADPSAATAPVLAAAADPETVPTADEIEGTLLYLSMDRVVPNPGQPRKHFSTEELAELSENIRTTGLLQPIVVRRGNSERGQLASYEIIAGERRFRAAKMAGLMKIPAILRQLNDQEALEVGLIENIQRSNLNPIEEAAAYQRLIDDFGSTQAEVAEKVGKDRTSVTNMLRLLKLDSEVQQLLSAGRISAGHGRALLMAEQKEQLVLARRIVDEGLSVRAVELMVATAKEGATIGSPQNGAVPGTPGKPAAGAGSAGRSPHKKEPALLALEERLRRLLGTKVTLTVQGGGSGEVRISFFSAEELQGIVERLERR